MDLSVVSSMSGITVSVLSTAAGGSVVIIYVPAIVSTWRRVVSVTILARISGSIWVSVPIVVITIRMVVASI